MLDHDHRHALLLETAEQGENVVDLGRRESRHRLVRDQELRLGRHGARELELTHVDLRQSTRHRLRLLRQTDLTEDLQRFVTNLRPYQ